MFSVKAVDGDRANPRSINYELCQLDEIGCSSNPFMKMQLDSVTKVCSVRIARKFSVDDSDEGYFSVNITVSGSASDWICGYLNVVPSSRLA